MASKGGFTDGVASHPSVDILPAGRRAEDGRWQVNGLMDVDVEVAPPASWLYLVPNHGDFIVPFQVGSGDLAPGRPHGRACGQKRHQSVAHAAYERTIGRGSDRRQMARPASANRKKNHHKNEGVWALSAVSITFAPTRHLGDSGFAREVATRKDHQRTGDQEQWGKGFVGSGGTKTGREPQPSTSTHRRMMFDERHRWDGSQHG